MRGVGICSPSNQLCTEIVERMCVEAAEGIKMQCGREYCFGQEESSSKQRATYLSSIAETELDGLPTNNIVAERNLSVFDRLSSKVAKCRNKAFKAKTLSPALSTSPEEERR